MNKLGPIQPIRQGRSVKRHSGGRPTVFTENALRKLEWAFSYGFNDGEACCYASISTTALYDYQKKNPKFTEWKRRLRLRPDLMARITIVNELTTRKKIVLDRHGNQVEIEVPGNTRVAMWYLERTCPEEFSLKHRKSLDVSTNEDAHHINNIAMTLQKIYQRSVD